MIDMTAGKSTCAPAHHNHFHGNGNCDAARDANKREDMRSNRQTEMQGEIAPYRGVRNTMAPYDRGGNAMTMQGGGNATAVQNGWNAAAMQSAENAMTMQSAGNAMTMQGGWNAASTQANGGATPDQITDGYGTEHDRTDEQEEGMSSFPQDSFTEPMSADEAARNSWRALLARNVGRNVLVRFLMGTQNLITVEGELYEVGTDYIVIYQPLWDSHITADLYSVKFVEFREPPGVMTLA